MLDPLSGGDEAGVAHVFLRFLDDGIAFFQKAFHSFAFWSMGRLFVTFQDSFQTLGLLPRLPEMLIESRSKPSILSGLGHFRQRLDDLVLSAVKIFQFVKVQIP